MYAQSISRSLTRFESGSLHGRYPSAPADLALEIPLKAATVEQGSVKWFNDTKGYGVIVRDNGGEIFVHHAAILAGGLETLQQGQRVEYSAIRGLKGLQAEGVQQA